MDRLHQQKTNMSKKYLMKCSLNVYLWVCVWSCNYAEPILRTSVSVAEADNDDAFQLNNNYTDSGDFNHLY